MLKIISATGLTLNIAKHNFDEELGKVDSIQGLAIHDHNGDKFEIIAVAHFFDKIVPQISKKKGE